MFTPGNAATKQRTAQFLARHGQAVEAALGAPSAAASALGDSSSSAIALHPLALAGFTGVLSNALALLPIGRLDGGRAATAAFGRRPAAALGGLTIFALGLCVFFSDFPDVRDASPGSNR